MSKDRRSSRKTYSAADREAAAQARRDKVTVLHEQISTSVQELTSSQAWADMLAAAARFHSYSFRNVLLIQSQCPTATKVAGFGTWKQLGRSVRKGEKGIAILAPCTYRTKTSDAEPDRGETPDNAPVEDAADTEQTGPRRLRGFKVAYVFDIAQTEGEPIPEMAQPELPSGQAPAGLWESLAAHVAELGYELQRRNCAPAQGYSDGPKRIVAVDRDLDEGPAAAVLTHELAHVILGHTAPEYPYAANRDLAEVAAESVAAIVCKAAGMDTVDHSAAYLAGWAAGDTEVIAQTATVVVATATALIARHLDHDEHAEEQAAIAS